MTRRFWLSAAILVSLSASLSFLAEAYEFRPVPSITLVQVGSSYADGISTPLWAINSGDTTVAEKLAFTRGARFGPYGLDATLWVRDSNKDWAWKEVTFVFPGQDYDTDNKELLLALPVKFGSEKYVAGLPQPLNTLSAAEIAKVDFVIAYNAGGAKVYLKTETTTNDALQIFEHIGRIIKDYLNR